MVIPLPPVNMKPIKNLFDQILSKCRCICISQCCNTGHTENDTDSSPNAQLSNSPSDERINYGTYDRMHTAAAEQLVIQSESH